MAEGDWLFMLDKRFVSYHSWAISRLLYSASLHTEKRDVDVLCLIPKVQENGLRWLVRVYNDESVIFTVIEYFRTYLEAESWLKGKGYL